MNEAEAKTKWCHQTKRDVETPAELGTIRCIGSACMAWRWIKPVTEFNEVGHSVTPITATEGFCGLALLP